MSKELFVLASRLAAWGIAGGCPGAGGVASGYIDAPYVRAFFYQSSRVYLPQRSGTAPHWCTVSQSCLPRLQRRHH